MAVPLLALPLITALLGGGAAAGGAIAANKNSKPGSPHGEGGGGLYPFSQPTADFSLLEGPDAKLAEFMGTGGTGPGSSSSVDTSAARNSTQNQLNSLDKQLANMNKSSQDQYDQLMAQYLAENSDNLANYNDQVSKNEATRSGGISQSLAAAAQGGRGLRSALAAMGALGGTGQVLANRAIASSANKDVGGVNETFDTNATSLNNAWRQTEREQRQREEDARTSLENAKIKNAGSIASQRQSLLRDMSGFWEQAGNKAAATEWLSKVSAENPTIERASLTATPAFQRSSAAFSPGALKNYLAGNQDMTVQTNTGSNGLTMNSPIYASRQRREEYA